MKPTARPGEEGGLRRPSAGGSAVTRHRAEWGAGLAAVLGCLAATAVHMGPEWTLNETYHYGWLVPALAAYLVSLRWRDRPPAVPARAGWWPLWGLAAAAVPLLWIVREANPDWRLVGLVLAGLTVGVALLWFGGAGGWGWVCHFAGSLAFLLLAAPWPTPLETEVTEVLMAANAGLALEVLHWLGVPAVRAGSLINVPGGTLGVEEACSGIRSLQATLMMAFFLGEMSRLAWRYRGVLVALGIATALGTNVARTVWLSVLAAGSSPDSADRWHDAAGLVVLAVHAAVLFAADHAFGRRASVTPATPGLATRETALPWPVAGPCAVLASLALSLPLSAWWYGRHVAPSPPSWALLPPISALDYEETPIPRRTRQILRYETGWSARWRTPTGHSLHAFFLAWGTGHVPPEVLHHHDPGNCLALAGMTLVHTHPDPLRIEVGPGAAVWARCLEFSDRGQPLFVFHAVEESLSGGLDKSSAESLSHRARLRSAWLGRRSQSLRLIEVGIWQAAEVEEARAVVADFLRQQIRPGEGP